MAHISEIIGKTMVSVTRGEYMNSDAITFICDDGARYQLFHAQECYTITWCNCGIYSSCIGDL